MGTVTTALFSIPNPQLGGEILFCSQIFLLDTFKNYFEHCIVFNPFQFLRFIIQSHWFLCMKSLYYALMNMLVYFPFPYLKYWTQSIV